MRTRHDIEVRRLALEAGCDPRTALRALNGEPVRVLVGERLKAAAKKLKIKLPKETC